MGQVDDLLKDNLMGGKATPKESEKEEEGDKELRSFRREMLRNKLQKDMFASDQPPESASAVMVKSQADLVNSLLGKVIGLQGEAAQHLRDELGDIKADLKHYREVPPSDPVTALLETEEKISRLGEYLKSKLGLSAGLQTSGGDLTLALEIERLKGDREERDRQWKEERDDLHRRWKLEDDKWAEEFGLKKQEFEYGHAKTDKVMDNFGDLVKAGIDSMEPGGGEATPVQRLGQAETAGAMIPRSFKCFQCGKMVKVDREKLLAICSCGAEYDMVLRKGDTDGQTPPDQRRKVQEKPSEKPGEEVGGGEDVASVSEGGGGESDEADREE